MAIVCNVYRLWISWAVPEISWSGPNLTEILHVFGPHFFLGGGLPPEFLKSIYEIQSDSDHVAKFQGDRSRQLGEPVTKQKKTSGAKYKPVRNYRSGRPKNLAPRAQPPVWEGDIPSPPPSDVGLQTGPESKPSNTDRFSTKKAVLSQGNRTMSLTFQSIYAVCRHLFVYHSYVAIFFRDVNKAIQHKAEAKTKTSVHTVRYTVCHTMLFSETKLLRFWTFKNILDFYFSFMIFCLWYFNLRNIVSLYQYYIIFFTRFTTATNVEDTEWWHESRYRLTP